ncbi:MAG: FtsX-like permease family protein [Treponema sp.]|nr:FtsX-like permease family protein [Treponema sp.]
MEKAITTNLLALTNLRRKPYRTAALVSLIALSGAVLFGSLVLVSSLKGGIHGLQSRIGADLMIVPEGFESKMEGVLLSGEPSYFYLDKEIEEKIRGVEGVGQVTGQFYLTSVSESCCDFPVQIIGFENDTDFILKKWARKKIPSDSKEVILAGSNISIEKNSVKFFANIHKVSARLAKSGTGMDNVIFADLATLQKIFDDAKKRGFGFISDGDTTSKTSVILVKLAPGYRPDGVALRIKNAVSGIQIVQSQRFISSLVDNVRSILVFLYAAAFLVILITVIPLSIVFSLSVNERLREFSILRVLGAVPSKLCGIVLKEAAVLGGLGAVSGVFIGALVVLPFNLAISQKLNMPFVLPDVLELIGFAAFSFAVLVLSTLLSSVHSAVKVSKHTIYEGMKI